MISIYSYLLTVVPMDAEERKRIEATMAQILRHKKTVEANPTVVIQTTVKEVMAEAKRRLRRLLLWAPMVAAVVGIMLYLHSLGRWR